MDGLHSNCELECAVDGAPSQIPTLKFLTPQHPQVPPLGHDPSNRIKILFNIISFICENTHKVWYKNLWNWHGIWNLMLFDFWPHPKVTSLTLGWKFYLHSVLLSSPSIWYATWPCLKFFFLTPWAPPAPVSPIPGGWPRGQNENPIWYVLYLSFGRTRTKFGI